MDKELTEILSAITEYADLAHGNQTRKYTAERYIVHPVRVMETCKEYTGDISMLAAAILHDVLEDTPVTPEEMLAYLKGVLNKEQAERTLMLVVELTDVYTKEAYPKQNRRERKAKELARLEKTGADSQTIKYADIMDNCFEIVKHDRDFARIFLFECRTILRKLDKGNQVLYKKAMEMVERNIAFLNTLR